MKAARILFLCLSLILTLALCLTFAACGDDQPIEVESEDAPTAAPTEESTEPPTEAPTEAPTEEATEAPTDAPDTQPAGDDTTGDGDETSHSAREDYPEDQYVVIENVEDLMAFNRAITEDYEEFEDITVIFLNDIDLADQTWIPLSGDCLWYVTFEGQGHTIRNMHIDYNCEREITGIESELGCGFIGNVPAGNELYFQNMVFEDCSVTARERHVGCLVGRAYGTCTFENITVRNFKVDGWTDYNNTAEETDGYPICFRVGGVMGASWGGTHTFTNVAVENLDISGFHNLAGILGYEAANQVDEYSFDHCRVDNAKMYFSYCLSASYTVDMPRKFVSVFFNGANWIDNIDQVVEAGENTYSNISFFDVTDDNAEYTPQDFRSWTAEEAGQ